MVYKFYCNLKKWINEQRGGKILGKTRFTTVFVPKSNCSQALNLKCSWSFLLSSDKHSAKIIAEFS